MSKDVKLVMSLPPDALLHLIQTLLKGANPRALYVASDADVAELQQHISA
jgi:hypothetical protein